VFAICKEQMAGMAIFLFCSGKNRTFFVIIFDQLLNSWPITEYELSKLSFGAMVGR
jgi:hypothetical protein